MKKTIKKEMSIEDLATMVARGFDRLESKIDATKDDLYLFKRETELNFKKVDESFIKIRGSILDMGDKFVSKHEFDKFVSRFNLLEAKVKGKK